jgi:hypothetical protein
VKENDLLTNSLKDTNKNSDQSHILSEILMRKNAKQKSFNKLKFSKKLFYEIFCKKIN